jgi:hypothetical protein
MALHNEQLAQKILSALEAKFPQKVMSEAFKKSVHEFEQVPQEEWLLALEALYLSGLVEGNPYPRGFAQKFSAVINLRITPLGRESIRPVVTWKSFYWNWLNHFGKEFYEKRKGKVVSAVVGAITVFLAGHSTEAWINWRNTATGTLLGLGAWTLADFVRVPWLMYSEPSSKKQSDRHTGFTILGLIVFLAMLVGIGLLTTPLWMPKRHRYAIPYNDEFANLTNAQHAFKSLSVQVPNCVVRLTAPPENRQVVQILSNVAGDFCRLDTQPNSNSADVDVLSGSEENAVVIHVSKAATTKDEIRDGILGDLQNVLSIRLKHDLPAGSPSELLWIQVGRGYPWRKDSGD